jgi:hypothetical protein
MWMGGNVPPLGYDVGDRKLVVNETEAEIVRHIFRRYADLGSVFSLMDVLKAEGIVSKRRTSEAGNTTGGKPFQRGALYHLLQNRTYLGEITHKGASYPGPARRHRTGRSLDRRSGETRPEPDRAMDGYSVEGAEPARRLDVRRPGPAHDAKPCPQERQALPLLRLSKPDQSERRRSRHLAAASPRARSRPSSLITSQRT